MFLKIWERVTELYINAHISGLKRANTSNGRAEYLRLDMNENPEGLPDEFVKRVLGGITPKMLSMYPESQDLVRKIAAHNGVEEDQITLTNGSDEALKTIFEVFGEPGKGMLAVTPTFAMYPIYAKMYGMEIREIAYGEDFSISIDEICDAITEKTSIVSLVNPNNPIGNVYEPEQLEQIIVCARGVGALVIVDEAYHYFYRETALPLLRQYDNLIVIRTFSKLFSLAALRIGYAAAQSKLIRLINAARPTYTVNAMAITFATAVLEEEGLLEHLISTEKEGKRYLTKQLEEFGYPYIAGSGNFLFIKTKRDYLEVVERLKGLNVLVKSYDLQQLKGYIRVTTGSVQAMEQFWTCFRQVDMVD